MTTTEKKPQTEPKTSGQQKKQHKVPEQKRHYRIKPTRKIHLLMETAQEITISAWDDIYEADSRYEDSRMVLEMFRDWAFEFESKNIDSQEDDYYDKLELFISEKVKKALSR